MLDAIVHNIGEPRPAVRFKYLAEAMRYAHKERVTGYVITPASEVIEIKKGKRLSADQKKWIPCDTGYLAQ